MLPRPGMASPMGEHSDLRYQTKPKPYGKEGPHSNKGLRPDGEGPFWLPRITNEARYTVEQSHPRKDDW